MFYGYLIHNLSPQTPRGKWVQVQSNPDPELTTGLSDHAVDPTQSWLLLPRAASFSLSHVVKNISTELEHGQ